MVEVPGFEPTISRKIHGTIAQENRRNGGITA
jgi:hypothetical protein